MNWKRLTISQMTETEKRGLMSRKEHISRLEWKNKRALESYGKSYAALCSARRNIIDQLYELIQIEEFEKTNPKRGCK